MKVSWEYYSQHIIWKVIKAMFQTTNQFFLANHQHHLEKYEFVNGKDYPIYYGK